MRNKHEQKIEEKKTKLQNYFDVMHRLNDRKREIISLFGTEYDPAKHHSSEIEMGDSLSVVKQEYIDTPEFRGMVMFHETYDSGVNLEAETGSRNDLYILGQSGDRIVEFTSLDRFSRNGSEDQHRILSDGDLICSSLDTAITYMRNKNSA